MEEQAQAKDGRGSLQRKNEPEKPPPSGTLSKGGSKHRSKSRSKGPRQTDQPEIGTPLPERDNIGY